MGKCGKYGVRFRVSVTFRVGFLPGRRCASAVLAVVMTVRLSHADIMSELVSLKVPPTPPTKKCDQCIQWDRPVPGTTPGTQQMAPHMLKNYKVLI